MRVKKRQSGRQIERGVEKRERMVKEEVTRGRGKRNIGRDRVEEKK